MAGAHTATRSGSSPPIAHELHEQRGAAERAVGGACARSSFTRRLPSLEEVHLVLIPGMYAVNRGSPVRKRRAVIVSGAGLAAGTVLTARAGLQWVAPESFVF